jgi:hypothetical protein
MQEEEMIIIMMITKNEENKKGKKFRSSFSPLSFIVPGKMQAKSSHSSSIIHHYRSLFQVSLRATRAI